MSEGERALRRARADEGKFHGRAQAVRQRDLGKRFIRAERSKRSGRALAALRQSARRARCANAQRPGVGAPAGLVAGVGTRPVLLTVGDEGGRAGVGEGVGQALAPRDGVAAGAVGVGV